jgi:outer membrane receptor protein involved in Fe transport
MRSIQSSFRPVAILNLSLLILVVLMAGSASAQETGTISGKVVDDEGRPVNSATVVIPSIGVTALSGTDGTFLLTRIPIGFHTLEVSGQGFTTQTVETPGVTAGQTVEVIVQLVPLPVALDEIQVTASVSILRDQPTAAIALDRDEISELPHFGDDLYRAINVLPGTSGGDFSARFAVRGGLHDETLVTLDDQELMEPFHLKDFQGIFSIIDPEAIGGVELTPGGFTAKYGDRMTGVLDMITRSPKEFRAGIGISLTTAWANAGGLFSDGKGSWLVSARRGYLDFILKAVSDDDDDDDPPSPRYWDAFGKFAYAPNPNHSLSLTVLLADDDLLFEEFDEDETVDVVSGYTSTYVWLSHQAVLGGSSFVNTALYLGEITVDRDFLAIDDWEDERFDLLDIRDDQYYGLRQEWQHHIAKRHYLRWGFDVRAYDVSYDYSIDAIVEDPIDDPRFYPGERVDSFQGNYEGEQYSLFVTDRMRLSQRFTAEVGLRYDKQTLTDDDQVSPRINLLFNVSSKGALRLGWGHFYQSQRPYELRVEFGETEFQTAQRAEQIVVGYETEIGDHYLFKADAYARRVSDPHRRWETIFDPFHPVPEAATDLALIAPEEVNAHGVELYFVSRMGGKFDWWMSYVYSSIEDVLYGVDTPRFLNQPHAVTASAIWRPGSKWSLAGVLHYHTGWPTTAVSAWPVQDPDGDWRLTYDVGPFYQEFLNDYMRLDLRASRTSRVGKRGALTFFIDIQNLTSRDNLRGIAIADPDYYWSETEGHVITFPEEYWFPIIPSFGVSYEF